MAGERKISFVGGSLGMCTSTNLTWGLADALIQNPTAIFFIKPVIVHWLELRELFFQRECNILHFFLWSQTK